MADPRIRPGISRRFFLQATGAAALAAACGGGGGAPPPPRPAPATEAEVRQPSTQLSGQLRILMWSHFVPSHDEWFDPFARQWGQEVGVDVIVDHINTADVPARISAEIAAGEGHDLIQHIAPIPQYEPSVVDLRDITEEAARRHGTQLEICRKSSFNPTTEKFFAYSPSWVPDPGNFRRSLWEQVGMADGPTTWDDLLRGGSEIKGRLGIQMGIGMSNEIDSNMAGRALLWSFGAAEQDENENVVLNSDQTVQAVEFMTRLFQQTMTPEVFAWNAASNNQGLIAGQMSYILNSISAYRTAQEQNPDVAADVFFSPALRGPADARVASHVMYNWIIPNHAANVDAAKEFLLHYTDNFDQATDQSQLYDLPAFENLGQSLPDQLGQDPYGSQPPDKLSVLRDATNWSTNVGYPGPASTAIGDVFAQFIIPNMFARAARGEVSPRQAVEEADAQIRPIFETWKGRGLIGGGAA
jgi:multiple sugar transport system substrate-binding protein